MCIKIEEGMQWPPINSIHTLKMKEHACWYSGEPALLADFYFNNEGKELLTVSKYLSNDRNSFWGRMIKNKISFCIHVPVASDIAETSASFLFGESPIVRVNKAKKTQETDIASDNVNQDASQTVLDLMLNKTNFFQKICEAAETSSAVGGVYIKIVWDTDVCEYPIPLVVQADNAIPEFTFGFLTKVTFPYEYKVGDKTYRLMEEYSKGTIKNTLYEGSDSKLGKEVPLTTIEETKDLKPVVDTGVDDVLARYIPNMLPNRIDRSSRQGRSDLQGKESMMDALDEVFSNWMREVQLAKGKILVPEDWLSKNEKGDDVYNIDTDIYVKLDVDPTATTSPTTVAQFVIHANELEKTALNLLDRIITSAGYSPQSFGLNIQGRAESGTALNTRERKSFATTNKKQKYWEQPLKDIIQNMCLVYTAQCNGKMDAQIDIDIEFQDGITNNMSDLANSVKMLSDAQAISTKVKVETIHPDWSEKQVTEEVQLILDEGKSAEVVPPDGMDNPDMEQLKNQASEQLGENKANPDVGNNIPTNQNDPQQTKNKFMNK